MLRLLYGVHPIGASIRESLAQSPAAVSARRSSCLTDFKLCCPQGICLSVGMLA